MPPQKSPGDVGNVPGMPKQMICLRAHLGSQETMVLFAQKHKLPLAAATKTASSRQNCRVQHLTNSRPGHPSLSYVDAISAREEVLDPLA